MDYKGYAIRHNSFHRQVCAVDANGNPTELMDTVEITLLPSGYNCQSIKNGFMFDTFDELKQAIDATLNIKAKVEAKFIMCQVPQGVCAARYCVETGEISFSDFGEWKVGKGHIYE